MRYYLKSGYKASIKGFKTGNFSEVEKINDHNDTILANLYGGLLDGSISVFYQRTKDHLIIAHKSTRPGVIAQVSHNWIIDGQIIPVSHANINSFSDLLKEHPFYEGKYITEVIA